MYQALVGLMVLHVTRNLDTTLFMDKSWIQPSGQSAGARSVIKTAIGSIPAYLPSTLQLCQLQIYNINNDICGNFSLSLPQSFFQLFTVHSIVASKKLEFKFKYSKRVTYCISCFVDQVRQVRNRVLRYGWQLSVPARAFLANKQMGQTRVYLVLRSSSFLLLLNICILDFQSPLTFPGQDINLKISIELSIVLINTTGY